MRSSGFEFIVSKWTKTMHNPVPLNVMSYSREREVSCQVWCHQNVCSPTYSFIETFYILLSPIQLRFSLSFLNFNSSWSCKNKERKSMNCLTWKMFPNRCYLREKLKRTTSELNAENSCWAKNSLSTYILSAVLRMGQRLSQCNTTIA